MNAIKVGKTIAFLRNRYNMTQKQLAGYLGVSDKAVSRWERGVGLPDVSLLVHLAVLLDIDVESLLEGNLTENDRSWAGALLLDYPSGLNPMSLLYDKPLLEYSLSYIMLAGISDVYIWRMGHSEADEWLGDGDSYGIDVRWQDGDFSLASLWSTVPDNQQVMLLTWPEFIYAKDLSRTFRRVLYGEKISCQLTDFLGRDIPIRFLWRDCHEELERVKLERGTLAFPVDDYDSLLQASHIAAIARTRMGEDIANLYEIAENRGMLSKQRHGGK